MNSFNGFDNQDLGRKRRISTWDGMCVVKEFHSAISYIRDNWTDEVGQRLSSNLLEKELELKEINRSHDRFNENMQNLEQRIIRLESGDGGFQSPHRFGNPYGANRPSVYSEGGGNKRYR